MVLTFVLFRVYMDGQGGSDWGVAGGERSGCCCFFVVDAFFGVCVTVELCISPEPLCRLDTFVAPPPLPARHDFISAREKSFPCVWSVGESTRWQSMFFCFCFLRGWVGWASNAICYIAG